MIRRHHENKLDDQLFEMAAAEIANDVVRPEPWGGTKTVTDNHIHLTRRTCNRPAHYPIHDV